MASYRPRLSAPDISIEGDTEGIDEQISETGMYEGHSPSQPPTPSPEETVGLGSCNCWGCQNRANAAGALVEETVFAGTSGPSRFPSETTIDQSRVDSS
ncbi:hypothetical protein PG987_016594 [Apiospora arundinis]